MKKRLLSWALVWEDYPWWQLGLGIFGAMLIIIAAGIWMQGVNPNDSIPASDTIVRIDASCDDPVLEDVTFDHPADIDLIRNTVVIYSRHKVFNLVVEDRTRMTVTFTLADGGQFVVEFGNETVCFNGDCKALKNEPGKTLEQLTRRLFEE